MALAQVLLSINNLKSFKTGLSNTSYYLLLQSSAGEVHVTKPIDILRQETLF